MYYLSKQNYDKNKTISQEKLMNLVAVAIVLAIVLATHPTFSFVSITVAISPRKVGAKLYFFVIAASQKM